MSRIRLSKLSNNDVLDAANKIINGERYKNIESVTGFKRSTVCYNINKRLFGLDIKVYDLYQKAVKEHIKNKSKKGEK